MGRPIKEKFFGNASSPYTNYAVGGATGLGGEGFNTIIVTNTASNGLYTTSTTVTWVASTPQLVSGTPASGTANVSGAGRITSLNLLVAGTGYTSTSGVTVSFTPATTGTAATVSIALTAAVQNAIAGDAYITTGSSAVRYDILAQRSSRRYLVRTSQGQGIVKLVGTDTGALSAGEMNILATDANGSTYFVKKLTSRRAVLVQSTASGSFLFDSNEAAGWTLGAASSGIVSLGSN